MAIELPTIQSTVLVSDNPRLAAEISCLLALQSSYLPVIDGPRLTRPDHSAEVARRNNAIARVGADRILLAGLDEHAASAMEAMLPPKRCFRISEAEELQQLRNGDEAFQRRILRWGRTRLGEGTLLAMRKGMRVSFEDTESPVLSMSSQSGHVVVCEAGEELSEIIAANYAFALGASLKVIPTIPNEDASRILERYYQLQSDPEVPPAETLEDLQETLFDLCGGIDVPSDDSITFISRKLPLGIGFPHFPSTHLFTYPDLGISVVNGISSELQDAAGIKVVSMVDPGATPAPEIEAVANLLAEHDAFVRGYRNELATVRAVSEMVNLFPYDLLIFATHCGDAPGYRWTYKFDDADGAERTLVVDIAIGVATTDDEDTFDVQEFIRFHSLDGVDWADPQKSEKVEVGTAIRDFMDLRRGDEVFEPIEKITIPRVIGSAAMRMFDNNYIPMPRSLASEGSPIVINNACVSWHELATRFVFSNARAYVGTLYPVTSLEASELLTHLFTEYADHSLPEGLWAAQEAVYGSGNRRPYVMTGVYTQYLQTTSGEWPEYILSKLEAARANWEEKLAEALEDEPHWQKKRVQDIVEYYENEIPIFQKIVAD